MPEILGYCASCVHYRPMGPTRGMCRRFPPGWVDKAGAFAFPAVGAGDLCGEWRAATTNERKFWEKVSEVGAATAPAPNTGEAG